MPVDLWHSFLNFCLKSATGTASLSRIALHFQTVREVGLCNVNSQKTQGNFNKWKDCVQVGVLCEVWRNKKTALQTHSSAAPNCELWYTYVSDTKKQLLSWLPSNQSSRVALFSAGLATVQHHYHTTSMQLLHAFPKLHFTSFYNVCRVWKDFLPVGLLEEIFVFIGKGLALECCNLWCSHYFYHDFLSICSSLGKSISRPNFKEPGAAKRRAEEVVRL